MDLDVKMPMEKRCWEGGHLDMGLGGLKWESSCANLIEKWMDEWPEMDEQKDADNALISKMEKEKVILKK
jgi:hypothetical protein